MKNIISRILDLLEISIGVFILLPLFGIHKISKKLTYDKGVLATKNTDNKVLIVIYSLLGRLGYIGLITLLYFMFFSFFYIIFNLPVPDFIMSFVSDLSLFSENEVLNTANHVIERPWYSYFYLPFFVLFVAIIPMFFSSSANDSPLGFILTIGILLFIFIVSMIVGVFRLIF